jgi:hypothetical protein
LFISAIIIYLPVFFAQGKIKEKTEGPIFRRKRDILKTDKKKDIIPKTRDKEIKK